jgi:hypothetical protein
MAGPSGRGRAASALYEVRLPYVVGSPERPHWAGNPITAVEAASEPSDVPRHGRRVEARAGSRT